MHDVSVKMKDNRELHGPLWAFKPHEGFMSLAGEDASDLDFNDIAHAEQTVRSGPNGETKVIDLLERARNEGWKGADRDGRQQRKRHWTDYLLGL
jgi:hypothetical protein